MSTASICRHIVQFLTEPMIEGKGSSSFQLIEFLFDNIMESAEQSRHTHKDSGPDYSEVVLDFEDVATCINYFSSNVEESINYLSF